MKSIKQQYIDLREGRMSQANFMRNLRMTMPQYITNITSFNDSVKILKNKGILSEMLDPTQAEEIAKTAGSYEAAVDKLMDMGLSSQEADKIANELYPEEEEYNKEEADEAERINMMIDQERENQFDEVESLNEAKDEKTKWTNTSGKSMYDQFSEINNLNAQEVLIGIDYEREKNPELTKAAAAKIVVKNLKKNPIYYTSSLMAGKEGYEAEYIGGKSANPEAHQMQYLDKNMGNVVDKKRGMQPVKGIEKTKKDSDKGGETNKAVKGIELMSLIAKTVRGMKKMDATGEKMKKITMNEVRFNDFGDPNEVTSAAMQFIDSNPTLKSISDKLTIQNSYDDAILRYDYWEVLPANALAKLEMQFTVERMNDFDEDTGTIIAYRLTPKRPTGDIFDRNAGITAGLNDINENELMERVYKKLKEITGAYGGDDMGAEDGSSYVNN